MYNKLTYWGGEYVRKEKNMKVFKKIACFVLVLGLVLTSGVFVACGTKDKNDKQSNSVNIVISVAEANQILKRDANSNEFSKNDAVAILNQVKDNMLNASAVGCSGKNYNSDDELSIAVITNTVFYSQDADLGYYDESWKIQNPSNSNELITYRAETNQGTTTYSKRTYTFHNDEWGVSASIRGYFVFTFEKIYTANISTITVKDGKLNISFTILDDNDITTNLTEIYGTTIIENGYVVSDRLVWSSENKEYDQRSTYTWNENVDAELLNRANNIPDVEWIEK